MTEQYFYEDLPECDVVVEPGYPSWENEGMRTIAVMANSDKGVAFLTAYWRAIYEAQSAADEEFEFESGSFEPEELDRLKRQANLAGVALVWRGSRADTAL